MTVQHFSELNVYKNMFALQQEIFELSKSFPREEKFSLTDQLRRSSRSVCANIAEAWQKRRYEARFIRKLTDSDAELAETQHWIATSLACSYIDEVTHESLINSLRRVGAGLGKMIQTANQWTVQ